MELHLRKSDEVEIRNSFFHQYVVPGSLLLVSHLCLEVYTCSGALLQVEASLLRENLSFGDAIDNASLSSQVSHYQMVDSSASDLSLNGRS